VVDQFNQINNIELIARAHQLVMEGYKQQFDNQLVTVWSAPNYCYRCGNVASVMKVPDGGDMTSKKTIGDHFKIFSAVVDQDAESATRLTTSQYFI